MGRSNMDEKLFERIYIAYLTSIKILINKYELMFYVCIIYLLIKAVRVIKIII